MKKDASCVWYADLVNVARNMPMPMPPSRQRAAPANTRNTLPLNGTPKTTRPMPTTRITTITQSAANSGAIFATMISVVVAGDMRSCSIVPASRSFTRADEATSELFRMQSSPTTPVTVNHAANNPGL